MRRLLLLTGAIVFVDTMFFAALTPLLPHYVDELDMSKASAGVLAAMYPVGALVKADGTILAQSGGISITSHTPGLYILNFGSQITGKLILASNSYASEAVAGRGSVIANPCGGAPEGSTTACPAGNDTSHVEVATSNPANTVATDHSFYVAVVG